MANRLRLYDPESRCPACGAAHAQARLKRHSGFDPYAGQIGFDRIQRKCVNCGNKWYELPLDALPQQQIATLPAPTSAERKMAALSYICLLWLIPLLSRQESEFVRFHMRQAIVLSVLLVPGAFIWPLALPFLIGFAVAGITTGLRGRYWLCPLGVGSLALRSRRRRSVV